MYDEERPYTTCENATDAKTRQGYWDMASGLQAVDGLETSAYANAEAKSYISGDINARELASRVERHYNDPHTDDNKRQADLVATRITGLLDTSPNTRFELTGRQLCIIHGTLFEGVLPRPWVGTYRTEDIFKAEPILGGRSVEYSPAAEIAMAVNYDMAEEKATGVYDVHDAAGLKHFVSFISGLWQTHPFREGNTRTTAVFSQLYLRRLGVDANNEPFLQNSLYYRDALVRASVIAPDDIEPDLSYLTAFYDAVVNDSVLDTQVNMNVHGIRVDENAYRSPSEYLPKTSMPASTDEARKQLKPFIAKQQTSQASKDCQY